MRDGEEVPQLVDLMVDGVSPHLAGPLRGLVPAVIAEICPAWGESFLRNYVHKSYKKDYCSEGEFSIRKGLFQETWTEKGILFQRSCKFCFNIYFASFKIYSII